MRKMIIILSVFTVIVGGCGQAKNKQTNKNEQDTFSSIEDTVCRQTVADNFTVEDTVRYQIGGKLYGLNFRQSDSITVIESYHHLNDWGLYREYHFIVHSRYSNAHFNFADTTLNSIYNRYMTSEYYRDEYERMVRLLDSIQSKHIDFSIKDFNGYWIYLKEYNGNYFLNDEWSWHSTFHIADSVFTNHYMDGLYPKKILEAVSLSGKGISIFRDGDKEPIKIEIHDKSKNIYRILYERRLYYIAPARSIHNFEIIQYTNNTGDLI